MVVERLMASFASMLDKITDMMIERGGRSDLREEQQLLVDARTALMRDRPALMAAFEKRLRHLVDGRISGADEKLDFASADASELTLVDHLRMDESVITSNITRVVENSVAHARFTKIGIAQIRFGEIRANQIGAPKTCAAESSAVSARIAKTVFVELGASTIAGRVHRGGGQARTARHERSFH